LDKEGSHELARRVPRIETGPVVSRTSDAACRKRGERAAPGTPEQRVTVRGVYPVPRSTRNVERARKPEEGIKIRSQLPD
jgi:hypothetical protein